MVPKGPWPFPQEESPIVNPRFDPRGARPGGFTGPRTNHRIRVPEVRVVGAEGEMLGVLPTHEALRLAREKELDLVEVNPKAVPPVCKIMDYGKYKYEEKKRENKSNKGQLKTGLKEVKLRPKTDDHDLDVKLRHIRRFLEEGNKVKVTCRFRGREITHPETAERQLVHFLENTKDIAVIEQGARMEAKTMTILLAPKPEVRARAVALVAKRAEEGGKHEPEPEEEDDDDDEDEDDED